MPLGADALATIRDWVGPDPTDDELEARYVRVGSYDRVVETELRHQISELASQPSSVTVPGLSVTFGQQLQAKMDILKSFLFTGTGLDEDGYGTVVIHRLNRRDFR
jgi:hypothetical protein